jgi:short-subunit dehydrogenase involved in D-alanine esterification of teichoic acids
MNITYIVPDDSEYLRSSNMRDSDNTRIKWNSEIKNSIKNYFNIDVIINSTGIQSESYYIKQKEN